MSSFSRFFFILGLVSAAGNAALLPDEQNNVDIYQKYSPAVVNITATTLRQDFFFDVVPQKGLGSGAIIKPEGYVLTNFHVIGNAVDVEVTLQDKTQFPAKVVGVDPDSDTAVLKIDPKGKKLTVLEYGKGELLVGQKTLAIGNPFGLGGSLTTGVISSLGRDIRSENDRLIKDIIQTDAAINPGNSGGPLLNSSGQLIGINTQILSQSGGSHGVGLAISVKTLQKVVDQLINFGQVLRPDLGMEGVGLGPDLLASLNIPTQQGVMVTALARGGPLDKAGLRPATKQLVWGFRRIPYGGDIIVKIGNTPINTFRDILDLVSEKKAGDTLEVVYFRGKLKRTAQVRLAIPPSARAKSF